MKTRHEHVLYFESVMDFGVDSSEIIVIAVVIIVVVIIFLKSANLVDRWCGKMIPPFLPHRAQQSNV